MTDLYLLYLLKLISKDTFKYLPVFLNAFNLIDTIEISNIFRPVKTSQWPFHFPRRAARRA